MATRSDGIPAPWRLKVARAEHHLVELEAQLRRYSDSEPWAVRWVGVPKRQPREWQAILSFTHPPGTIFPLIVGDAVHNLRSALDHLAGALVPRAYRRRAYFPIIDVAPEGPGGEHREARDRLDTATAGMEGAVKARIEALQPYAADPRLCLSTVLPDDVDRSGKTLPDPANHVLRLLNGLDNADKHRRLIVTALHFPDGVLIVRDRHGGELYRTRFDGPQPDQAPLIRARPLEVFNPTESEVQVQFAAPCHVMVHVGQPPQPADMLPTLRSIARVIRDGIFPGLEPYVR